MDNLTNDTFNCRGSELSSSFLTNRSHWQIEEGREIGTTIIGVILVLMFIVGTIWNLFIIITFFVKHHLLREPANIFLLNVAIVDLLLCMTAMVFSFVTAFAQEYVFGDNDVARCAVCDLDGFFFIFLIFLSLHLLTALSVDRFLLLSRPLRYKQYMNRWKAILICVIMYVICFIVAILPVAGFGQYEFNLSLSACLPRFTPTSNFIYLVVAVLEALVPVIILAITNVWTYRLVSKFLKRNFRRKSTYRRRDVEEASSGQTEGRKHQKQQKQLVKVFGALLIGNAISYTPTIITVFLYLVLLLNSNEGVIPDEVYIIGFVSFLTSAVIHPIVESFFVKELRYQVNRARKGVRRVSTNIYRQTTQLFSKNVLEEAAMKADDDTTPRPKRNIRFLNGRIADASVSAVTEMDELNSSSNSQSRANTPTPEPPNAKAGLEESTENTTSKKVMLDKSRKSVSFQENPRFSTTSSNSITSPMSAVSPVSCLKQHLSGVSEEPAEEEEAEEKGDKEKGVESPTSGDVESPTSGDIGSPTSGDVGSPTSGDVGSPTSGDVGSPTNGDVGSPTNGDVESPTNGLLTNHQ
jgi:hypothetical protein